MKIYFAGFFHADYTSVYKKLNCSRMLISYYYYCEDKYERLKMDFSDVFLDSGAFSAWSQNVKINLNDYIAFIKENLNKITVYANLDVINDVKATQKNQFIMEQSGLSPIPVFHVGEDYRWLIEYCKKYNYIALGGMVGKTRKVKDTFLSNCFAIIKNYFPVRVHGFALTDTMLLKKYPFYSIDTMKWAQGIRYKNLTTGNLIRNKKATIVDEITFNRQSTLLRIKPAILNVLKLEQDLTSLWKMRGISWDE